MPLSVSSEQNWSLVRKPETKDWHSDLYGARAYPFVACRTNGTAEWDISNHADSRARETIVTNQPFRDSCRRVDYSVLTRDAHCVIQKHWGWSWCDNADDDRLRAIAKDKWRTRDTHEHVSVRVKHTHVTANGQTNLCTLIVDFFHRMLNKRWISPRSASHAGRSTLACCFWINCS